MERIAGTPVEIAVRLRAAVRDRVGLPVTVGVARTKFLAKVASGVAKPDGLIVVPPDRELEFLHPLPVECVWGVGPATSRRLQAWNVRTIGELASLSESTLVAMLGQAAGRHLNALAHNRDFRRVQPGRRRGSIGSQRALGRGRRSPETIDATLVGIVDRIARRLRAARRVGRTVALLATAAPVIERRGITLVGCSVAMLEDDRKRQLLLGPEEALDAALDAIRDRFGSTAITRAVLLGRDSGFSMPLLPD
jgi:DNA polymerase-4